MNKKIKVGLITCCSLLLLTGCSPVSHKTQHQEKKIAVVKKHSSKKIVNEDGVRLSTKLTPKEIASAITVCAANKYHGTWVKVLNEARTNGLKISFHIPYILHCSSLWAKVRPVFSWVYADKAFVLFQSFYFFLLCGE